MRTLRDSVRTFKIDNPDFQKMNRVKKRKFKKCLISDALIID